MTDQPLTLAEANYRLGLRNIRAQVIAQLDRAYRAMVVARELGTSQETIAVTPEQARAWLVTSPVTPDPERVAAIAADLAAGRFVDRGNDPVQLTAQGRLLNGHTRLAAIVETGATVELRVASGAVPNGIATGLDDFAPFAASVIDAGRTAAAALTRAYLAAR
jgi:hypothetical protein